MNIDDISGALRWQRKRGSKAAAKAAPLPATDEAPAMLPVPVSPVAPATPAEAVEVSSEEETEEACADDKAAANQAQLQSSGDSAAELSASKVHT